jgi:hypothetical protein
MALLVGYLHRWKMHILIGLLAFLVIFYYFNTIVGAILFFGFISFAVYLISSNEKLIAWILVIASCILMVAVIGICTYKSFIAINKKRSSLKLFFNLKKFKKNTLDNSMNNRISVKDSDGKAQINDRFSINNHKLTSEFHAKYPFVMVHVNPSLQTQFIHECEWFERRLGHFPSESDQIAILKSLEKASVIK